ncbi:hypothetical protein ACEQ8H_007595 [Pleosporales sp. CAS-2024a]
MPVNTLSVGAAVTPTVIHTYLSHYLNRRPLAQKPTAHISYHEGLELIRRFLRYASFHTVDELQAFTSQWVPVPRWVHVKVVDVAQAQLARSADIITAQLGPKGIEAVGGQTWWQWRRDATCLSAEWIEMRKDYDARKQLNIAKGDRIMLYVHGGAYFFGSVDEHRYQLQRHARKLKARVIAPRYRLAPQFPFPCGLHDCLAVYLHLLDEKYDPTTIILAGDSAGGGMVLSMLVTLRDQGIPLPAGAILISPWVDLTHSFPSLAGDGDMDYIPAHGFLHKPSLSWPPPNADDLLEYDRARTAQHGGMKTSQPKSVKDASENRQAEKEANKDRVRGYSIRSTDQQPMVVNDVRAGIDNDDDADLWISPDGKYSVGPKSMLSVQLDSETRIEIKDQIQMYVPNHLLTHPLVSPALQPTLGGLPPLLIQTGGGELLRDEQIYVAHKAAQPLAYLPPPSNNQTAEEIEAQAGRYNPTNVNLQVWDDLCHVCPTLSFTRPAKHMYRSIAQFGAWALARAQKKSIDIVDDDDISIITSGSSDSSETDRSSTKIASRESEKKATTTSTNADTDESVPPPQQPKPTATVGRAGDPLPPFEHHMIRQRIDRHGHIYPLTAPEELVALQLPMAEVGVPKKGPVSKWMKAQQQWNTKFEKQKIKIQKQRLKDMEKGFEGFDGEIPPPTALAGRRVKGMKAEKPKKKSWGMSMWAGWGSKHDSVTIDREKDADQHGEGDNSPPAPNIDEEKKPAMDGANDAQPTANAKRSRGANLKATLTWRTRSRSRHSAVTDRGQANGSTEALTEMSGPKGSGRGTNARPGMVVSSDDADSPATLIPATDGSSTRPTKGGIAYPFSLRLAGKDANASMVTLNSVGITTPRAIDGPHSEKELGAIGSMDGEVRRHSLEERRIIMTEHFSPDAPGAGLFSNGVEAAQKECGSVERPQVERFVTAPEDVKGLIMGKEKDT